MSRSIEEVTLIRAVKRVSDTFTHLDSSESRLIADAVAEAICNLVRGDFDRELFHEGATSDSTMAVRGWLKVKGLWSGPDTWSDEVERAE